MLDDWDMCSILFGEPGANAPHNLSQRVHHGTRMMSVDFILAAEADHDRPNVCRALAANPLAQAKAPRVETEVRAERAVAGASEHETVLLAPRRFCTGQLPSNTVLFHRPDPFSAGRPIALYECEAARDCRWGIDSFAQWSVNRPSRSPEPFCGCCPLMRQRRQPIPPPPALSRGEH
jgi:glucose-6-phosphate isomerase